MDNPRKDGTTIPLICVIDDDQSVREALSNLIRSAGFNCAVFSSAKAFLDSRRLAETGCLVLDVDLPGLCGPELQLKLREMNWSFPIVFVTARVDNELRAKVLEQGASAVLDKPFSHGELLDAIRSTLNPPDNE